MAEKQKSEPDVKLVFLNAEAFLEVSKVALDASNKGNTKILNLALATTTSFALEIYLKCLLLLETGNAPRDHDLYNLFHSLKSATQSELTKDHEKFVKLNPAFKARLTEEGLPLDLEELLKRGRNAFVDFRYAYEHDPVRSDFALNGLTKCVREQILKIQPDWDSA
jgi:HEPN domain-containing protein